MSELCKKECLKSGNVRHRSPLRATEDMKDIENVHKPAIKTVTSAEWMAQREIIYAERNRRIQEVCKSYSLPYNDDKRKLLGEGVFWFDLRNHLSMCMHAKVACTTWKRNFLLLSGLTPKEKKLLDTHNRLHFMVYSHIIKPILNQKENGFDVFDFTDKHKLLKVSFVRHPYERLISCYENKVIHDPDAERMYFEIVEKYNDTSFATFVDYVLEAATKKNCFARSSNCWINRHFRPYYSNCFHCHIEYDVIGHLEDSADDVAYIAAKLNLTSFLPELSKTRNKTKGKKSNDWVKSYMSQLSKEQKEKLFELYKLDFALFGYEPENTT